MVRSNLHLCSAKLMYYMGGGGRVEVFYFILLLDQRYISFMHIFHIMYTPQKVQKVKFWLIWYFILYFENYHKKAYLTFFTMILHLWWLCNHGMYSTAGYEWAWGSEIKSCNSSVLLSSFHCPSWLHLVYFPRFHTHNKCGIHLKRN